MVKRRRLSSFFDDNFDPFADLDQFHALFEDLMRQGLEQSRAKSGPHAPLVYGFSMNVGPDGKPHVEPFGNVRQGKVTQEREPVVDVQDHQGEVRIIAELPGVDKSAISIQVRADVLHLDVQDAQRPFSKQVRLPAAVESKASSATYKNGILEVVLKKKAAPTRGGIPVR